MYNYSFSFVFKKRNCFKENWQEEHSFFYPMCLFVVIRFFYKKVGEKKIEYWDESGWLWKENNNYNIKGKFIVYLFIKIADCK